MANDPITEKKVQVRSSRVTAEAVFVCQSHMVTGEGGGAGAGDIGGADKSNLRGVRR